MGIGKERHRDRRREAGEGHEREGERGGSFFSLPASSLLPTPLSSLARTFVRSLALALFVARSSSVLDDSRDSSVLTRGQSMHSADKR